MIRVADFSNAALWNRPSLTAPGLEARGESGWFADDASVAAAQVAGDLSFSVRGLSVEQHAQRVLAHLCGEPDAGR
jgi:hypothetical protein